MLRSEQLDAKLPAILDQIAREKARTDMPLLRGEVVYKEGEMIAGHPFVGFYATLPVYYPESFWTFSDEEEGDVIFSWLLPIMDEEQMFIHKHGWSAFEQYVDSAKFELFDLKRPSLI